MRASSVVFFTTAIGAGILATSSITMRFAAEPVATASDTPEKTTSKSIAKQKMLTIRRKANPGDTVTINQKPLPPSGNVSPGSKVSINPQPLPPGGRASKNNQPPSPGGPVSINPQPLPPRPAPNDR